MIEPLPLLYEKHNFLAATGIYQATSKKPFRILVAIFSPTPNYLTEGQDFYKAAEYTVALMESTTTHGEILSILETKIF